MEVIRPESARAFLDLAEPLLAADAKAEARHNLQLGIAGIAADDDGSYDWFLSWVALGDGVPVAAATRTPPFNMIVADPSSLEALDALIDAVAEDDPEAPGVVGNVPHVHRAADRWTARTGVPAEVAQRQGVYVLTHVRDVPRPAGASRVATAADRDLLVRWVVDFVHEASADPALHDTREVEDFVDARLGAKDAAYWLWEDEGRPVALAGFSGPTPSGIRVGPVYTPSEHRRRGYATALVSEISRTLLDRGYRACFLYTDLANPTSNSIYARIGYEQVAESAEIHFVRPDEPGGGR